MKKNKVIWIAWEDDASTRSKILSNELNADFYTFTLFEGKKYLGLLRYFVAIAQTFFTILKGKPKVLVSQNPSVVLAFSSALIKPIINYFLIIDLHTRYYHPIGLKGIILKALNDFSLKRGDLIIVTNYRYKEKIQLITDSKISVLPDKIPSLKESSGEFNLKGKINLLFICTFSGDEPWEEVLEAATLLPKDICIYISGKSDVSKIEFIPSNVIFTGYLSNVEYQAMVKAVDSIMVLTNQEDCLVCGGYEAMAAEKPLILSDKDALRRYFNIGTMFTKNSSHEIAKTIQLTIKNKGKLTSDMIKLKKMRSQEWNKTWSELKQLIPI